MHPEERLARLVNEIDSAVTATTSDPKLTSPELRQVLRFLSKVIQIVEQSFEDVLAQLIDIKQLSDADATAPRLSELRRSVDMLTARSHYRDAEEICSRLKHLRHNFDQFVRPAVGHLPAFNEWHGILRLIEDREGHVITLIDESAREIGAILDQIDQGGLAQARKVAAQRADQLRGLIRELRDLNGRILGLSGTTGFLELTEDRTALRREVTVFMDNRDQSVTHGPRVTVGQGARIKGNLIVANEIKDSFNKAKSTTDPKLKELLETLCAQVDEMLPSLALEQQTQAKQDLSTFVAEATAPKPRRKWYELSSEGLIEAAKTCGKMTAPIVTTVKAIVGLLS